MALLSSSAFSAQTKSNPPSNIAATVIDNGLNDSADVNKSVSDTCCHSLRLLPDSVLTPKGFYNQNAIKFKYDAFKEQMKKPWIADALREILSR